jgi:hypothetical protein
VENHWGNGTEKRPGGPWSRFARILGVCAVSALAMLMVGCLGPQLAPLDSGLPAPAGKSSPATASAGTKTGSGSGRSSPGMFTADVNALVPVSRSDVTTTSKDGKHDMKLASFGLQRPPLQSLMAPLETLTATSPFGLRVSPSLVPRESSTGARTTPHRAALGFTRPTLGFTRPTPAWSGLLGGTPGAAATVWKSTTETD